MIVTWHDMHEQFPLEMTFYMRVSNQVVSASDDCRHAHGLLDILSADKNLNDAVDP